MIQSLKSIDLPDAVNTMMIFLQVKKWLATFSEKKRQAKTAAAVQLVSKGDREAFLEVFFCWCIVSMVAWLNKSTWEYVFNHRIIHHNS